VANTVLALTNSIGTVAVQNIKVGSGRIAYEGVPYSAANVINGSYPIWGYENYYFITSPIPAPLHRSQQAVLDAFYQSVTNAAFAVSPVFTNNFIPTASLKVSRDYDGGPSNPNARLLIKPATLKGIPLYEKALS
jgi:hypothetical protein